MQYMGPQFHLFIDILYSTFSKDYSISRSLLLNNLLYYLKKTEWSVCAKYCIPSHQQLIRIHAFMCIYYYAYTVYTYLAYILPVCWHPAPLIAVTRLRWC